MEQVSNYECCKRRLQEGKRVRMHRQLITKATGEAPVAASWEDTGDPVEGEVFDQLRDEGALEFSAMDTRYIFYRGKAAPP